ncbi:MAG: ECF transporter S component [Coriobacteriales bacterium]|jgi:ECF transporter S component (folate family)|nr:ECF transporter S component [Coriobacteriales bacterium]
MAEEKNSGTGKSADTVVAEANATSAAGAGGGGAGKNAGAGRQTRWSARQLATMALLAAMSVILSFIEFPIMPGADFLKYDASFVPTLLAGFSYGPVAGCLVGIVTAIIHAFFTGNVWGAVMNAGIVIAYVVPASFIYRVSLKRVEQKTMRNVWLIVGLLISCILMIAVAIGMNLVVTPIYTGVLREVVISRYLPLIIPFNIIKCVINSVLGFLLLKSLGSFLR